MKDQITRNKSIGENARDVLVKAKALRAGSHTINKESQPHI